MCSEKLSTTSVRGSSISTLHNPSDRIGLCPPRRADFRQQVVDAHGRIAAHDLEIGEALRPAVVVPPLQFGDVQPRVGHAVGLRHGRALQYVAEQRRGIVRDARHPCLRPVIVVRHHAFDRGVDVVHRPVELIRGLHPQFQPCQRLPGVEGPAPRVRPHPLPDAGQAARALPARRVVIVARRQAHLELVLAAGQVEGELPREGRAGIVAGQGKRLGPGAQARARREGHGQPGSGRRAALDAHRVAPVLHLDDGVPLHADVGEQLLVLPDGGQPPDIRYVVPPPLVPAHERQQPLGRLPGLAVRGRARPLDDAAGPVERKRVPAVQLDLHGFGPQLLRHAVGGQPPVFGVEVAVLVIDQRGVDGRGTGLQRERGRVDALVGFGEVPVGQQAVAHLKRGRGVHLLPGGRTPPQAGRPVEHELRLIDVVARLEGVAGAAFQRDAELLFVGVARVQLRGLIAAVAPVHVELHMLVFPKRRIPVADVGDFHRAVPGGVRGAQVVELFRGPLGVRLAEVVQRHAPDAEHLRDDLKRAQAVLAAGQKIDLGARAAHVQPRHFRRGRQQRAPEHGQAEARGEQQARPHGRRHAQKPGHGRPARAARPPRQRGGRDDGDHAEDGLAALAGQHSERHHVAGAGERGPPCLIRHIAHVEVGVPAPAHPCRNPHGVALFPDDRRKRLSPRHHTIHARLQGRGPADHPYALRDAASRRQPLPGITVHPANTFFPAPGRIRLNDGVPALKHMQHPARSGHEPHMGLHPLDPQAHHVAGAGIARRLPERLPRQIKRGLDGGPIQRGHVNDRARQGDAEPLAVDQTHQPPAVGPGSPAAAVTERHPDIVIPPCVHSHPPIPDPCGAATAPTAERQAVSSKHPRKAIRRVGIARVSHLRQHVLRQRRGQCVAVLRTGNVPEREAVALRLHHVRVRGVDLQQPHGRPPAGRPQQRNQDGTHARDRNGRRRGLAARVFRVRQLEREELVETALVVHPVHGHAVLVLNRETVRVQHVLHRLIAVAQRVRIGKRHLDERDEIVRGLALQRGLHRIGRHCGPSAHGSTSSVRDTSHASVWP